MVLPQPGGETPRPRLAGQLRAGQGAIQRLRSARSGTESAVLATPSSRGITATEGPAPEASAAPVQSRARCSRSGRWSSASADFTDSEIPRLNYTTADANAFADDLKDPAIGRFPPITCTCSPTSRPPRKHQGTAELDRAPRRGQRSGGDLCGHARHAAHVDSAGGANYLVTYDTEVHNGETSTRTRCMPLPIRWWSWPTPWPRA